MTEQLAKDEEARMKREAQDPLVRLKQQEIDLRAMETMMKQKENQQQFQKDTIMDAEKMDLERDKLEAQTSLDVMKAGVDIDKQENADAMSMLKENITTSREAMKEQSQERIAKAKSNGQRTNKNK